MRVLITGFGPFFEQEHNPSQALLTELKEFKGDFHLVTKELPVEFSRIRGELEAMDLPSFDEILFFGLAGSRKSVTPEKLALNIQYCPSRPDNAGVSFEVPKSIDREQPLVLESSFPCEEFCEFLNENGISSELSFHGGTYVCNTTLFEGLRLLAGQKSCTFVHLPKEVDVQKLASLLTEYFSRSLK